MVLRCARFARARSSAINWTDLDFHEHFIKQKFHVGKGKCLVKATEREMSVWSIEMSANRKGEARNHLRASYTQIFGCKLRGCKTKEFLLVYYSTFFSFSIHCQCTWSWLVTTWDHYGSMVYFAFVSNANNWWHSSLARKWRLKSTFSFLQVCFLLFHTSADHKLKTVG